MSQAPTCPPPGSVKPPPPPPPRGRIIKEGHDPYPDNSLIEERGLPPLSHDRPMPPVKPPKKSGLPEFDINIPIPDVKPPKPELKTVWICGKATDEKPGYWEMQGIFTLESLAVLACHNDMYFIAPMVLDVELMKKTFEMPGCRYPWRDKKGEVK